MVVSTECFTIRLTYLQDVDGHRENSESNSRIEMQVFGIVQSIMVALFKSLTCSPINVQDVSLEKRRLGITLQCKVQNTVSSRYGTKKMLPVGNFLFGFLDCHHFF